MVKYELLNTGSCFKHRYIFPHMNNSLCLRLEEAERRRGGGKKEDGEMWRNKEMEGKMEKEEEDRELFVNCQRRSCKRTERDAASVVYSENTDGSNYCRLTTCYSSVWQSSIVIQK